jgi:phosphatidylglycerol:prolipoprotein diacylglycerol transferase
VHPILFRIGSYEVPSYGVALALGFALGIAVARRRARAVGLDEERVIDACMIALVTSIVGARALWIATHLELFRAPNGHWLDAVNPFAGRHYGLAGLSMMGGVVLAAVASLGYLAWRHLPLLRTADVLAPSVLLGEGVTRIGCFLNGCCYGFPCDHFFCLRFPPGSGAAATYPGQTLHPTQLYASVLGFAGFFALSALWRRRPADGVVLFVFLVWVGIQRIGVDSLRYYEPGAIWRLGAWSLPASSVLAAALVGVGIAGLARRTVQGPARPGR